MDKRVCTGHFSYPKKRMRKNLPSNGKETAIKMQFSIEGPSRQPYIQYYECVIAEENTEYLWVFLLPLKVVEAKK